VELVITASRQLGIQPILGVRAKLSTQGVGRWGGSSGDRAKFGLTIPEIIGLTSYGSKPTGVVTVIALPHWLSNFRNYVVKDAIREARFMLS